MARDLKAELEWIGSASGEVTTVPTAVSGPTHGNVFCAGIHA
jgi:hypothetical protein